MPFDNMNISTSEATGDEVVDRNYIFNIDLPEQTRTYVPVGHKTFIDEIEMKMLEFLPTFKLEKENFITSREDQRMFGKMLFRDTTGKIETPLMWGFRNGYDKKTSLAFGTGAGVFVCSNMCISGEDVTYVRKHVRGVWEDVQAQIDLVVRTAGGRLRNREEEILHLKRKSISDDEGYKFLGLLLGHGVLKPRALKKALDHWQEPPFEEFEKRNLWSLYNSCTWALGQGRNPQHMLSSHQKLHDKVLTVYPQ